MRFRSYESLRTFTVAARHTSFSAAADELHLTKGAISHQIRQLENELGFEVFRRLPRGVELTPDGRELLAATQSAFSAVEQKIDELRHTRSRALTIGVTSYFASRWLSSRLMNFMRMYPEIRLRIQPMVDLHDFEAEGIDLAIRWGRGQWKSIAVEPLFLCPAWPCGNGDAVRLIEREGVEAAFAKLTLLRDRDDSTAWSQWFARAGLPLQTRSDTLIIPDPNVRVQAVIDGQGIALNDALITAELEARQIYRLSEVQLPEHGYFLTYRPGALNDPAIEAFSSWLTEEARQML